MIRTKHPRVTSSNKSQALDAAQDILLGFTQYPLWTMLGWQDIKQRYRRSKIGPFWITIAMALLVLSLGVIMGGLFGQPLATYLPYLSAGLVSWFFISSCMTESCSAFIEGVGFLRQMKLPLMLFPLRIVWRNIIILLHVLLIPVVVTLIFHASLHWNLLESIAGLALTAFNCLWVGLILALVSARFRDIPPIVSSLMQPLFYCTPIMWHPEQLKGLSGLVDYNPFYYFISLIRDPLLGQSIPLSFWEITGLITLGGWFVALLFYKKYRHRLTYWI